MSNESNLMAKKPLNPVANTLLHFVQGNLGILIALFVLCAIVAFISPVFLSAGNFLNVLRQVSLNASLAIGMMMVILLGGIDLSVGAVVGLSGTLSVGLIDSGAGVIPAVLIAACCGIFIGFINGCIISFLNMAPFIVTMSTMNIARGLAFIYTGGLPIRSTDRVFSIIGAGKTGPIPNPVIYMMAIIIIVSILLGRSKFGLRVYALGGNREAAKFSGINVRLIEIIVYTISGFLSGFAGIVLASRMYSGQPGVASGAELDAIAACVVGGVSMSGGLGKISGVVIGVLIVGVISNGLNLMNINSFWQSVLKGCIVLIAVYIDIVRKRRQFHDA
ncbi:MAG: ABC transporter permease [Spirochaetales bacterium]|jgi:ribose transport system permease protein|nr:ABC transporter permease [Spirochaetales bacterium]